MSASRHHRWRGWVALVVMALPVTGFAARGLAQVAGAGQPPAVPTAQAPPVRPEIALLKALQSDPLTAPFRVTVSVLDGHYVLSGRVGTKQAHDAVIRTAIALGIPARDDLVIDTREAYRATAEGRWNGTAVPASLPTSLYVYPPPLMGRLDDPFYGFEPPLVSYPPWWGGVAARAPLNPALVDAALNPSAMTETGPGATSTPPGSIEMTIDTRGVATIRGVVASLAQRVEIGQQIMRTPGIARVNNLLQVEPKAVPVSETPPPPPEPAFPGIEAPRSRPAPAPVPPPTRAVRPIAPAPTAADGGALSRQVSQALARRPALAALAVQVTSHDGVVTLSGRVPSAYEAMLAFRAAEQTPGTREVNNRLAFDPPDIDRPNPLRERARPEDLEPYLLAQLRRQLGALAHIDRVKVQGDTLEIRGTLTLAADAPRVEAALRSIPLLRGFRLEPHLQAE